MTLLRLHELTEGDDTFDFSGGGVLGVGEEAWRHGGMEGRTVINRDGFMNDK